MFNNRASIAGSATVSGVIMDDPRPMVLPEFSISEPVTVAARVYDEYDRWITLRHDAGWGAVITLIIVGGVAASLWVEPVITAHLFVGGLAAILCETASVVFLVSHLIIRKPCAPCGGGRAVRIASHLRWLARQYSEMRKGCCRVLPEHDQARYAMAVVRCNLVSAQTAWGQRRIGDAEFHCGMAGDGMRKSSAFQRYKSAHPSV